MHISIFEDNNVLDFEPISLSRPVFDLFCGTASLKDKILRNFPGEEYSLYVRNYLKKITEQNYPGVKVNTLPGEEEFTNLITGGSEILFVNGRVIADEKFAELDFNVPGDVIFLNKGVLAVAKLSGSNAEKFIYGGFVSDFVSGVIVKETDLTLADYIWDLIYANKKEIIREVSSVISSAKNNMQGEVYEGVWMVSKENIFIAEGVKIKPGVVIDASDGPVYIGRNSVVYANSVISGPVYIGENSLIKAGAKIYEGVSIGDVCKVGGEVEDSIIMTFSNKQHDGFLGHTYLGSWVNLGADTNCSDLRNNYGSVKSFVNGRNVDTGKQFLGLIMGDHSKTGINTMFNTGTTAGFSSNIYGSGFPDKNIPSFSWGEKDAFVSYDMEKAMDTAKIVMARRKKHFTSADEDLFKCIFEMTKEERLRKGYDS